MNINELIYYNCVQQAETLINIVDKNITMTFPVY